MQVPVGVLGTILNSQNQGHVVRIEDDRSNSGGFLVIQRWQGSNGPGADGWFDDWVQDREQLAQYIADAGWEVRWHVQAN